MPNTWTNPNTQPWATSYKVLATDLTTHLRDNLLFLAGTGGATAQLTHSANQAIATGTDTYLAFDTETRDDEGAHDPATNNSRLVVPYTGVWRLWAMIEWAANTNGERILELVANRAALLARVRWANMGGNPCNQLVYCERALTAGDYVEVRVNQSSGGSLNVNVQSSYSPLFGMSKA